MKGSILVLGAGISGMRASAESVRNGFKVFLLETRPTIGGEMARLDKMFPSNECATCTLLPKMLDLTSNPNVQILAFCDLVDVKETSDGFKVKVRKKVRYVDPQKCNACTDCFPVCPVSGVPVEFNFGRGTSKAISFWSPFPPRKALIYPDACTYLKEGKCGDGDKPLCAEACELDAIDFSQKPSEIEFEVGAIILAAGAAPKGGELIEKYGWGKLDNVLTSLEFERLLSGLGPTGGEVKRDDGNQPGRAAWIVCETGDPAALRLGFMAAVAEAMGTLERNAEAKVRVISSVEPSLEDPDCASFRDQAVEAGVEFIKSENISVSGAGDGNISVKTDSENIEVEMLVISPPIETPPGLSELADKLGIEVDAGGLPVLKAPVQTSKSGVFACGTVTGPKGIRESVVEACAAAGAAAERLAAERWSEIQSPPKPELRKVSPGDEPKTAVVICRCGKNIAGALDIKELADYTAQLPNVAAVEITPFGCDGVTIKKMLQTGEYNRLVIGACSPRTHEDLFHMHAAGGGLNPYLIEIVNLRNHCTWVHRRDPMGLMKKAKALMRMGCARVSLQEPLEPLEIPITAGALVLGGTPAGTAAAARLAGIGMPVHILTSAENLAARLPKDKLCAELAAALEVAENVTVYTSAALPFIEGYVGNFEAEIAHAGGETRVKVGSLVIASKETFRLEDYETNWEDILGLTRAEDGSFIPALGNFNTLDVNNDGVFLCGPAGGTEDVFEQLVTGRAAAARAAGIIVLDKMSKSPVVSKIIDENCDGCAYCIEPCPASAITLLEYKREQEIKKTVEVNEALCRGCGMCMATCPKQGAYVSHFKPEYIMTMVGAAMGD